MGSINEELESDSNSGKVQQQQSSSNTTSTVVSQKSSKEGITKGHKVPFGGLKKLIDRDKDKDSKDKDKDKEKGEKEMSKAASVIKSGLNDTKENMKKLIGKDKQNSKVTLQQISSNHHDENLQSHANNGDLKNSPLVLMKRSSDHALVSDNGGIDGAMINDTKDGPNCNNNGGSTTHGIISPFDSLNSDSDESEIEHPHHQLSTSSSASTNVLMETNSKSLANVQVSQV